MHDLSRFFNQLPGLLALPVKHFGGAYQLVPVLLDNKGDFLSVSHDQGASGVPQQNPECYRAGLTHLP